MVYTADTSYLVMNHGTIQLTTIGAIKKEVIQFILTNGILSWKHQKQKQ